MKTSFENIVKGLNLLNTHTKECLVVILPQLNNFIGKQIETQSGTSAKFKINFPELTAGASEHQHHNTQFYFDITRHSIWLKVKICLNGGSYDVTPNTAFCEYFEHSVYLGEMSEMKLMSVQTFEGICDNEGLNTIHSERVLIERIEQFKLQKESLHKQFSNIPKKAKEYFYITL